jgi:pilus assembly protein CpaB
MRVLILLCLLIAAAIAGATALVLPRLLAPPSQAAPAAAKPAPATRVLVAAENLPAGTIVKTDQVRWQAWPEQGIAEEFIVEGKTPEPMKDVVSAAVRRGFTAGEPITAARLVQKGEAGFLAAALAPGMRAVSVKVDAVSGTSGFILPGDRVDVMLTSQYEMSGGEQRQTKSYAEIVLADVRVLAIDQNMNDVTDEDTQAKLAATATLEVSLHDAQVIGVAGQLGRLTLVLAGLARPEAPAPERGRGFVEEVEVSRFLEAVKNGKGGEAGTGPTVTIWRGTEASEVERR